jgi:hypothetical protein
MKTAMLFLGIIAILAIFGLIVIGLIQPTSREHQSQYQGQPRNQSTPEKKEASSQQD